MFSGLTAAVDSVEFVGTSVTLVRHPVLLLFDEIRTEMCRFTPGIWILIGHFGANASRFPRWQWDECLHRIETVCTCAPMGVTRLRGAQVVRGRSQCLGYHRHVTSFTIDLRRHHKSAKVKNTMRERSSALVCIALPKYNVFWKNKIVERTFREIMKKYIVTGGAGFIGSALVRGLLALGDGSVEVIDNLSTGRQDNLTEVASQIAFHRTRHS